jgi:antitoxin component YwqK of YwqJK toxin-antitoxin module
MTRSFNALVVAAALLMGLTSNAAPLDPLTKDEAAIAAHIKRLHDDKSDVRATAAEALRRIIASYPSRSVYISGRDGGEAYWTGKVNQIKPGMTKAEVQKIMPPFPIATDSMNMASGQRNWDMYRLDYEWTVRILYDNPDIVHDRPTLIRRTMRVQVEAPKDYTGTWITWHVSGQKAYEIQYQNGKYNGTFTVFHGNGQKSYEQHYKNHVVDGPDTGWESDGKISYTGQYRNGKQDGKWLHLHSNGKKRSESNYSNGEYDGVCASWQENGQPISIQTYRKGVKHGREAAWNEKGELQYDRYYANGKIVDP